MVACAATVRWRVWWKDQMTDRTYHHRIRHSRRAAVSNGGVHGTWRTAASNDAGDRSDRVLEPRSCRRRAASLTALVRILLPSASASTSTPAHSHTARCTDATAAAQQACVHACVAL